MNYWRLLAQLSMFQLWHAAAALLYGMLIWLLRRAQMLLRWHRPCITNASRFRR